MTGFLGGGGSNPNAGAGPTADPTGGSDLSGGFNPDPQAFDPNSPMGGDLTGGTSPSPSDFAPGSPIGDALFNSLGMGQPPTPPSVNPPDIAGAQSGENQPLNTQQRINDVFGTPSNQAMDAINRALRPDRDVGIPVQGPSWFQSAVNQAQPQSGDPLTGSQHEGGYGFGPTPAEQVSSRYPQSPNVPLPRPRPPEAPQFPMPRPRPENAPKYGAGTGTPSLPQAPPPEPPAPLPQARPSPGQDLPVTPPASSGGSRDAGSTPETPATGGQSGQPSYGGQQQFHNPIEALLHFLLGGPMGFLQSLLGLTRQVGPNYWSSHDPSSWYMGGGAPQPQQPQQPPQSPQQANVPLPRRRPDEAGGGQPSPTPPSEVIQPPETNDPIEIKPPSGRTPEWSGTTLASSRHLLPWPQGERPSQSNETNIQTGINPQKYARALIGIESGGNPRERTGSNYGLVQFGPDEERMYMRDIPPGQRHQRWAQELGLQREAEDHSRLLQRAGIDPTPANLYLVHQQGRGGGPALLKADPNMPAWQAIRKFYGSDRVAKTAIGNFFDGRRHSNAGNIIRSDPLYNVPVEQVTAGQFINMWRNRFNRGYGTDFAQASGQ